MRDGCRRIQSFSTLSQDWDNARSVWPLFCELNVRNGPAIAVVSWFVGEVKRTDRHPSKKRVPGARPPLKHVLLGNYLAAQLSMATLPCRLLTL